MPTLRKLNHNGTWKNKQLVSQHFYYYYASYDCLVRTWPKGSGSEYVVTHYGWHNPERKGDSDWRDRNLERQGIEALGGGEIVERIYQQKLLWRGVTSEPNV